MLALGMPAATTLLSGVQGTLTLFSKEGCMQL